MKKASLISFTVFFMMAGQATAVWYWLPSYTEIAPEHPSSCDVVAITLGGDWPNSCTPNASAISRAGNNIYFDVIWDYPPDIICATVIMPWELTESVGPLPVGTYTVYALLIGYPSVPPWYMHVMDFIVTDKLILLTPNGGEKLVAGSTYNITWNTNCVVENVFIEYSDNNGVDWTAMDTVANTGSYPWLVPDINSNQCRVRISDANDASIYDTSDEVFRIYVCTLAYDLNHDCFVDFFDFSLLASEWLNCGDPCNPNCQP